MLSRAVEDADPLPAPPGVDRRDAGEAWLAEGADRGQRVVEPVAGPDQDQSVRVEVGRHSQRQLGVGVVLVGVVALDRGVAGAPTRGPAALIESRSPTNPAGASPAARAWSSAPSAAITTASRGCAAPRRGRDRIGSGDDDHGLVHGASLRRHYPDQVLGSVAATTLSARRIPRAPRIDRLLIPYSRCRRRSAGGT